MGAPDAGASDSRPLWQQVRDLLEARRLPLHTTRLDGTYVVAAYHHECGPLLWADGHRSRYEQTIPLGEHCQLCGWGADLPIPDLDAVADRLRDALGTDAALWAALLVERLDRENTDA